MQTNDNAHAFTLTARSHAEISGVNDVDCFNEYSVVLITAMGEMTVSGNGLNIISFNQTDGRLILNGEIDSIEYSGKRPGARTSFFARLVR